MQTYTIKRRDGTTIWTGTADSLATAASEMRADLAAARLTGANLMGANLMGARLAGADLADANLSRTCLDPAAPIPPVDTGRLFAAGLELSDCGEWVYGWRTRRSQHVGATEYRSGETYTAPALSVAMCECHPGIYLAGREWLLSQYGADVELVRCRCRLTDLHAAGDKFRCRRLEIL